MAARPYHSKKFERGMAVLNEEKRWNQYMEARAIWQKAEAWRDSLCKHDWHTNTTGGMHFSGGEVWDDTTETTTCTKCGAVKHVDNRIEITEPVTF